MKIFTEPTVHVLAKPDVNLYPQYELPPHDNQLEGLIATAGKLCYDSFGPDGRSVEAHVKGLATQEHWSVIEHANVSLLITGVSRGLSHELVRHRHFSFSQRSTRYTAEEDAAIVLDPFYAEIFARSHGERLPEQEYLLMVGFLESCERSIVAYRDQVNRLLEMVPEGMSPRDTRKWARGKARQLLPHALETRLVMTGNMRSWREMLIKRTSRHAEPEIRRLANSIFVRLYAILPNAFHGLDQGVVGGYIELH